MLDDFEELGVEGLVVLVKLFIWKKKLILNLSWWKIECNLKDNDLKGFEE